MGDLAENTISLTLGHTTKHLFLGTSIYAIPIAILYRPFL